MKLDFMVAPRALEPCGFRGLAAMADMKYRGSRTHGRGGEKSE